MKPTRIELELESGDSIAQIEMGYRDIFLLSYEGKVYHFQRNEWYETKTYSAVQCVELSKKIIDVSSGEKKNIFLSYEGDIFESLKDDPLQLKIIRTHHKFLKVSASSYFAGISKKGSIIIWGNSIHGNYEDPT